MTQSSPGKSSQRGQPFKKAQPIGLLLSTALVALSACRTPTARDDESATKGQFFSSKNGLIYVRSRCEVGDKERNESLTSALNLIAGKIHEQLPQSGILAAADSLKKKAVLSKFEGYTREMIEENFEDVAGLGIAPDQLICPNGLLIIVSGPVTRSLLQRVNPGIPVEANASLVFVVVPKYVQQVLANNQVKSFWRYQLGAGVFTFVHLEKNALPDPNVNIGIGAVWGPMERPGDLTGMTMGVTGNLANWKIPLSPWGGPIPFGNTFRAFVVSQQTDLSKIVKGELGLKLVVTAEWVSAIQPNRRLTGYVGASLIGNLTKSINLPDTVDSIAITTKSNSLEQVAPTAIEETPRPQPVNDAAPEKAVEGT